VTRLTCLALILTRACLDVQATPLNSSSSSSKRDRKSNEKQVAIRQCLCDGMWSRFQPLATLYVSADARQRNAHRTRSHKNARSQGGSEDRCVHCSRGREANLELRFWLATQRNVINREQSDDDRTTVLALCCSCFTQRTTSTRKH